jgi:hypothetical protein
MGVFGPCSVCPKYRLIWVAKGTTDGKRNNGYQQQTTWCIDMGAPCLDNSRHTAHAKQGNTRISKRISARAPQKRRWGLCTRQSPSHVTPRWAPRTGPPIAWALVPRIEAGKCLVFVYHNGVVPTSSRYISSRLLVAERRWRHPAIASLPAYS